MSALPDTPAVKLLHLPTELIHIIGLHADPDDIPSLRLACRRLCDIASPLLLAGRRLTVHLDQASLDRVHGIARNHQIARGLIPAVTVALHYRPAVLAADIRLFAQHKRQELNAVAADCVRMYGGTDDDRCQYFDDPDDSVYQDVLLCDWRAAHRRYLLIKSDWSMTEEADDDTLSSLSSTLLHDAWLQYRRKHDEQRRLILDGTFAARLTAALSRMPPSWRSEIRLLFCGQRGFGDHGFDQDHDMSIYGNHHPIDFAYDQSALYRLLLAPQSWAAIENMDISLGLIGLVNLPAVSVLTQLPIAMHAAGLPLRGLIFQCFPVLSSNIAWLVPTCPTPTGAAESTTHWARLSAACSDLRQIYVELKGVEVPMPIEGDAEEHLDAFFQAIRSSDKLQICTVQLHRSLSDAVNR